MQGREEKNFINYVATIKELPECIVYSRRMTVPNYDFYIQLGEQIGNQYPDLKYAAPEYCFFNYLDGEYKEKDINVEYCKAVTEMKLDFDDIVFKKMVSVTALSVMHKGAYSNLPQAYVYAFKWIEKNGYTVTDSPGESYIDGFWNKENEKDWLASGSD